MASLESLVHLSELWIHIAEISFHLYVATSRLLIYLLFVNAARSMTVCSPGCLKVILGCVESMRIVSLMNAAILYLERVQSIAKAS